MTDQTPDPLDRPDVVPDPWGQTVADFLADLLDDVEVEVLTDLPSEPLAGEGDLIPTEPAKGADGRSRQFRFRRSVKAGDEHHLTGSFPDELADLPAASMRALARLTRPTEAADFVYPSVATALHDVFIAELLADRLARRMTPGAVLDDIASLVAETLDYFTELAATRHEGGPISHGVVIAADPRGLVPIEPPVSYPGQLPTRKRTPLLFDGTQAVLVVTTSGQALSSVDRNSLPSMRTGSLPIEVFDDFPGLEGGLTAAASSAFCGVGVYLRPDHSVWVFDDGQPLFIRRTSRWKSIAIESLTQAVAVLGSTSTTEVADRVVRAALRMSMQGHGALFAIADGPSSIEGLVQPKDRYPAAKCRAARSDVDEELHRLVAPADLTSSGLLVRLARIDGATIIDTSGDLLAYGAIVRSSDSHGEGARTAAARALSGQLNIAIAVSQDGPITVFNEGEVVIEVL